MTELNDHELLAEFARSESEAAFAELTARHVNLVYSAALRFCGDAQHCEEITQAVFIILARKAGKLSPRVVLSGWLYQTVRLTAANLVKGEIRRQRREQEAYMQSTLNETDATAWAQLAPLLDEAMGRLGETDRNAVVLRFFENKTAAEVAAALKLTEAAAHKRVNRALEKLRKIFSKRGVSSTTAIIAGAISAHSVQAAPVALAKSVTAVAIAKGAAASGSTLTLIKGALKIMAWTKMKTAVVVGAGVLLALGTTTVTVKEIKSSRDNAIFERIWAQPDSRSMDALVHAPPALIVRPTHYPARSQGYWTDARVGHGMWVNASVGELVGFAYHFPSYRAVFPADMPGGGFDLMETLSAGQNEAALKKEIQKRFGLVGHTETREADTLRLVVHDLARLTSHVSAGGQSSTYGAGGDNNTMNYVFKNQTLKDVASGLEGYFQQPVVEPNGLTDHYDFTFQVNYKLHGEVLQQSFRDQLAQFGLELVPGRAPIEMLVVEKAK